MTTTLRSRALATIAAAALVVAAALAGVLLAPAPAHAHNSLVASTPGDGEQLTELPESFSITTDQALLDLQGGGSGFALQVVDAEGRYFGDGCVEIVDATMSTPAALGAPGDYTLRWQIVSADGHTVSDEFGFSWAPAGDVPVAVGSTTVPDCNGTAAPGGATEGGTAPDGDEQAAGDRDATVPLGDVLWIGGAVLAVLVAVGVTVVILTRRKPADGS